MASGSTGAPASLPFPVSSDQYAIAGDVQALAVATNNALASRDNGLVESVQDTVGAMVKAGSGITVTYDDGAGTETIAAQVGTTAGTLAAGDDARLSDARTPKAHAATHAAGGSDPVTPASIGAVATSDSRLTDARTPVAHASTHASGGSDPITPASIGAAAASHAHAIADTTGLQAALDAKTPLYTVALAARDLNTLTTPGTYLADQSADGTAPNMPANVRGILAVSANSAKTYVVQTFRATTTPTAWSRTLSGSTWSGWLMDDGATTLVTAVDWNTMTAAGAFVMVNSTALSGSTNAPASGRILVAITAVPVSTTFYLQQTAHMLADGRVYSRTFNAGTWSAWLELSNVATPAPVTPTNESAGAGLTNALLLQDFTRRRGGRKRLTTGAVAFRFDHGLMYFDQMIRPLMEARGIPYSLAINAGNWSHAENSGITPAIVDGWVQGGLCEVWNHSLTHNSTADEATWRAEIVDGLSRLRADLPHAQIDGWAMPSLQNVGYGAEHAFADGGTSVAAWYDSAPGRLILATHAVSTGYIPQTYLRVADGTVRQGQLHWTLDKTTLDQAKGFITQAQQQKRALQFMQHPSLMNSGADYITTDTFAALLDYVVAERDAGRLAVLGPYDLMLADIA